MDSSSGANPAAGPPPGPPYPPQIASLGGTPTNDVDTPITAVFLALYIGGAIAHMTILQVNLKRSHKFLFSGLLFGFCMARITTCIMRIVWANRPQNVNVAISAQIFVNAGVVLLYLVNLIFAQRILRASHPSLGWHGFVHSFFIALYVLLVISLCLLIAFGVVSFFTLDPTLRTQARDVQWYGSTAFLFLAFLPLPILLFTVVFPRPQGKHQLDKFGTGRHRTKIAILAFASTILTLGSSFRVGTGYLPPRPRDDPAWYQSKACFYCFDFMIEIIVLYLYVLVRVDRRFHIPDRSHGAGAYSQAAAKGIDFSGNGTGPRTGHGSGKTLVDEGHARPFGSSEGAAPHTLERHLQARIMTEEEAFDESPREGLSKEGDGMA